MENKSIPIHFNGRGIEYKGWATPSRERHDDGHPMHYIVVLNELFFGHFWLDRGKWFADEPRPRDLVVAVGTCLDRQPGPHRPLAF
jgi:hypothetical protein